MEEDDGVTDRITILGAGSWGIACGNLLAANGARVTLWEFDPDELAVLVRRREHPQKLPGIKIPADVRLTNDLNDAISEADVVVCAVPTQQIASVCRRLAALPHRPGLVVNLSKGIEEHTLRRVSQIITEEWSGVEPQSVVSLSGPSHAEEVAVGLPTTVVVAGQEERCRRAQEIFSNPAFRVYRSRDLIGVELGGAVKNVIAIAAGIARGLGFGDNTQGALITRGLAEMTRLAVVMGADPTTLSGLSGVGDLVTTSISRHSRNQYVGYQIGQGQTLKEVLAGMVMVAEGVTTCRSTRQLARRHQVEMPITDAVCAVLFEDLPARQAVTALMTRPLKAERWQS
jgi:glycerol-3-phosphate dehydrogenase (NAD(P)+)